MVGLRPGHSVYTITCTSDRSGMASSGTSCTAQIPPTTAKPTSKATRKGLWALHSITRLIISPPRPYLKVRNHRTCALPLNRYLDVPGPLHPQVYRGLVNTAFGVGGLDLLHLHSRHGHRISKAYLGIRHGPALGIRHLNPHGVGAFLGRFGKSGERDRETTGLLFHGPDGWSG